MTTPVVKTIKASGGDYATLAAWWAWAKTQTMAAQWAEVAFVKGY